MRAESVHRHMWSLSCGEVSMLPNALHVDIVIGVHIVVVSLQVSPKK